MSYYDPGDNQWYDYADDVDVAAILDNESFDEHYGDEIEGRAEPARIVNDCVRGGDA